MAPRKRIGLVQVKLRIPEDLKRRLDREAKKREDVSLSAEIAARLEGSFSAAPFEERLATAVVDKLLIVGLTPPGDQKKRGDL